MHSVSADLKHLDPRLIRLHNYSKSAPTSTSTKFRLEIPYDIGATQIQYGFITDLADLHIVYDQFDHNGSQLQLTGSFSIPQHYI